MTSGFAVVPGLQGICLPICIHYALMLPTVSTSVSASWLWGCCSAPLLCVCVCTWAHMCGSQKLVSGVSIDLSLPCLWDKLFHWAWGFPIILNGQQDPRIFLCLSQCWDYRHGLQRSGAWTQSGPYACAVSTLPTKLYSQFLSFLLPDGTISAETKAASNCLTVPLLPSTILLPVFLCQELASHNHWDMHHPVRRSQGSKAKICLYSRLSPVFN